MQYIGCPLIGDKMYRSTQRDEHPGAAELDETAGRQALHAEALGFTHPATGQRMVFQAGLPDDLKRLERLLVDRTARKDDHKDE
jgi:23S rRNA pseudouridine1911/1915/1917 synthase